MDRQRETTESTQVELFASKPKRGMVVTPESVHRQPTHSAAIRFAIIASGLQDKQVYGPLKIDKAQWSRILSGDAHFPHDKYLAFLGLVGNDIPLMWLAHRRGYELTLLRSSIERERDELKEQVAAMEARHEQLIAFVRETRK